MPPMPADPLRLAFIGDPNSVHTRRWIHWFAAHDHAVHLLDGFGDEIRPGLDPRVVVERYRAHGGSRIPGLSLLKGRRSLQDLLRRIAPDVLHAHFVRRYGWQASIAGFHPYVVTPWGSDLLVAALRTWRVRWWDRRTLSRADVVTVVSDYMRDAAAAAGARLDRIEEVQFGVDVSRFAPGPADPGVADRLRIAEGRVVFSPRAIRPLYRHETIVDAVAGLPDDVVLVMTGRAANPAYLASIRARLAERGMVDRTRIIDDITDEDLPELYRMAAVVVSMPESDSFALTILEAMASGAPVIAGDLPPVRAELGTLTPEYLVPIGDVAQLQERLQAILALGAPARADLGARLRRYVLDHADYEANMARMETIYRKLAGQ